MSFEGLSAGREVWENAAARRRRERREAEDRKHSISRELGERTAQTIRDLDPALLRAVQHGLGDVLPDSLKLSERRKKEGQTARDSYRVWRAENPQACFTVWYERWKSECDQTLEEAL